MSTSLSNLPSSIPVVASSRIPQVEESSSSEGERHDVYESDEESRSVTEEEEADSDDNRPNSLYSINKYSRQDGLRRNAVHRAHSPSDNRARPTEDDGDDVQEPLPGADDDAVDIGVLERLRKMSKGAAKRVVKNPRPKLDPQCLLSNKGLPALLDDFKKVKFRGKGHEFQDLEKLLYVYEAWANRVVPRLTFPEVVERLEHVGSKREIHVALDRLRNGIWPPYASNEQVEPSEDESEREHEDPDALWRSVIESVPQNTPTAKNTPPKTNDVFKDLNSTDYQDTQDSIDDSNLHLPQASTSYSSESRVERNRRLALERLAARKSSAGTLITNKLKTPTNHILKNALKAAISAAPSSSNSELTNKLSSEFSINEKSDDINSSNTLTQNSNAHNTTLVDTMSSHTVINATNDDLHHSVLEQFSENHNDDVLSTVLQEVESPCYVDESNLVIDLS
uniref:TIMELESS-interacting protein n=1 Tax=Trichobilharzia regenti TaxID=157069 RepID=A0AA85JR77_TRIRE|nr:unnamed protein product [Trichobilharzia regenti]